MSAQLAVVTPLTTPTDGPAPDAPAGFEDMPMVMSPKTLAEILDVTTVTLERWRAKQHGPRFRRFPNSNLIRYTRADVIAWLDECAETTT